MAGNFSRFSTFACFGIVIFSAVAVAYSFGNKHGFEEGQSRTTDEFRLWANSILFPDPAIEGKRMLLVGDGAVIVQPTCKSPRAPYIRLSRLPDLDGYAAAEILEAPTKDAWIARIPKEKAKGEPLAAATVGCFLEENRAKV